MTWAVPDWYVLILLALATYRVWRLLAEDAILDPVRRPVLRRFPSEKLVEFVECPFCAGWWIGIVWWLCWTAWPEWTTIVAVPFALNAVAALVAARLDPG